jgi:hypothetical protein
MRSGGPLESIHENFGVVGEIQQFPAWKRVAWPAVFTNGTMCKPQLKLDPPGRGQLTRGRGAGLVLKLPRVARRRRVAKARLSPYPKTICGQFVPRFFPVRFLRVLTPTAFAEGAR